jgi:hypothetical protein
MPQCGPFSIELRVWDRDALGGLAHERGATIADVRRDLDAAAGINIYRDGFRGYLETLLGKKADFLDS